MDNSPKTKIAVASRNAETQGFTSAELQKLVASTRRESRSRPTLRFTS